MKITRWGRRAGIAVLGMLVFLTALLPVARANCAGELAQNDAGGFQQSQRDGAGAAAAHRAAQNSADCAAKIIFRAERRSVRGGGPRHAAIRIPVAAL